MPKIEFLHREPKCSNFDCLTLQPLRALVRGVQAHWRRFPPAIDLRPGWRVVLVWRPHRRM